MSNQYSLCGNIYSTEEIIKKLKKKELQNVYGFLCSGTKNNFTIEYYLTNNIRVLRRCKKVYPIAIVIDDAEYDF